MIAQAYWRTHSLEVSITRSCNNYGPYQFPEKMIPLFVTNLLEGRPVPLYGTGRKIRQWLHVEDHCRAVHLVFSPGKAGGDLQHRRRTGAGQPHGHRTAA